MMERDRAELFWALKWQVDIGADEAPLPHPVDRLKKEQANVEPRPSEESRSAATVSLADPKSASTLEELRAMVHAFDGCPLKLRARNTVFCDGDPRARVMFVGEAPGEEEDRLGRAFVGRSGQLLDKALSFIDLDRRAEDPAMSFYITNIVNWRPPGNRNPNADEIEAMLPFCERHIELANPEILVLLGNIACKSLLRTTTGITKLRGQWMRWRPRPGHPGMPTLPTFHPSFLLRQPGMKRHFWNDLKSLRARLDDSEKENVRG